MGTTLGNLNGVAMSLAYALVNSMLALLVAFGVHLTNTETAAVLAFVNCALALVAYIAHVGAKHTATVIPAGPVQGQPPTVIEPDPKAAK